MSPDKAAEITFPFLPGGEQKRRRRQLVVQKHIWEPWGAAEMHFITAARQINQQEGAKLNNNNAALSRRASF
jgi:hypothetical protein